MSTQAARLARLFTPEYARRVNAQIVHPAESVVVKPNELESGLSRPLHVAAYEPDRPAAYLAATLSYGIIMGHPFQDGNKRTGFFLANEYLRAMGLPGLTDAADPGKSQKSAADVAKRFINVAAGKSDVTDLATPSSSGI